MFDIRSFSCPSPFPVGKKFASRKDICGLEPLSEDRLCILAFTPPAVALQKSRLGVRKQKPQSQNLNLADALPRFLVSMQTFCLPTSVPMKLLSNYSAISNFPALWQNCFGNIFPACTQAGLGGFNFQKKEKTQPQWISNCPSYCWTGCQQFQ